MKRKKFILFCVFLIPAISAHADRNPDSELLNACTELSSRHALKQSADDCVKLAKSGDANVQAGIGAYFLGKDDFKNAESWFRKSASQGNRSGQNGLGYLYQSGSGVEKNRKIANEYFLKSAKQGHPDSQFWLGENLILAKNYKDGYYWTDQAARNGSRDAQYNLAILYKNGQGVKKDEGYMYFWFKMAAANGHEKSREFISALNAQLPQDVLAELAAFVKQESDNCQNCINR